jgi:HAD superfamily hydrolase (TIGR01490 family)
MTTAFFDLDKTLLAVNSARLWVQYELRHGRISKFDALQAMAWLVRYRLGATALDAPLRQSIASLRGGLETDIRTRSHAFYQTEVRHLYRPGGLQCLEAHRLAGDRVVLLTSTSEYIARAVCDDLKLDGYLCTRFAVDAQGRYTGEPVEPICFGHGKLTLARQEIERAQHPLSACTFYTDSTSDLPVLEQVGNPVAVNPDPRLKRKALQLGWKIVDWGTPALLSDTKRHAK